MIVNWINDLSVEFYQPFLTGNYLRYTLQKLPTGMWSWGQTVHVDYDLQPVAPPLANGDNGYALAYAPTGEQSAAVVGNHHLYEEVEVIYFENEDGASLLDAPSFEQAGEVRVIQGGYLLHPATGTTRHATIRRTILLSDNRAGTYERLRLTWQTNDNKILYVNSGQLKLQEASFAWVEGCGSNQQVVLGNGQDVSFEGTLCHMWREDGYAAHVQCPSAETIVIGRANRKVYPRPISTLVNVTKRHSGQEDVFSWSWSYSKHSDYGLMI